MNIISRDDEAFLKRLTAIAEANLGNEQFGVNELSVAMKISRSQIHRKLKSISNQSVSQFIREIRLKKAKEYLENEDFTVSEIAYKVGFGSPSYFIKCFHEYFGYPPGEYIKYASTDSGDFKNTVDYDNAINKPWGSKTGKFLKWVVSIFIIISAFIPIFLIVQSRDKNEEIDKSIIVLPFKNLSDNENNQRFVDGISITIREQLEKIPGLSVVPYSSSEIFSESGLIPTEIAHRVNVNFVIEGSFRSEDNNVRISAELIDAQHEIPLWSELYNMQMEYIYAIQNDIVKNVVAHLESIDSPGKVDKIYTNNQEAYNLYLQGISFHRFRAKESFEKSIECFNKALELDSNYCQAYAGLADTYFTSTFARYYTREEGIPKSRAYATKALSIDADLAEAHAVLGAIATYYDHDWSKAEYEFKRALKLNPEYGRSFHLYAQYLDVIGNRKEARKYLTKALDLNPTDVNMVWFSYFFYRKEGNYDKAFDELERLSYLYEDGALRNKYRLYLRQNKISRAIEEYKKYMANVSPETDNEILDQIFAESGKEGVVKFVIGFELKVIPRFADPARQYAIINEKDSALAFLERAYEKGDGGTVRLISDPDFEILYSEPRFQAIVDSLNLRPYFPMTAN